MKKKNEGSDVLSTASKRERQILEILFKAGEASAADVRAAMDDPPSYSAVRALLSVMEAKGLAFHRSEGAKYLYRAAEQRGNAANAALDTIVSTFFGGSTFKAAAALLDRETFSADELEDLEAYIKRMKQKDGEK